MPSNIPSSSELIKYWDNSAGSKDFCHPLPDAVIEEYFPAGAKVLDIGCGYGRLSAQLANSGFSVSGCDTSSVMLELAKQNVPTGEFRQCQNEQPWKDNTFDVVLLVTLLTSVPLDLEQRKIVEEIKRVLKPGGQVFVSDMPLQWSPAYLDRYQKGLERYGQYGVFSLSEGVTVRHHDLGYFMQLMSAFTCLEMKTFNVVTMNGNSAQAVRYVGQLTA